MTDPHAPTPAVQQSTGNRPPANFGGRTDGLASDHTPETLSVPVVEAEVVDGPTAPIDVQTEPDLEPDPEPAEVVSESKPPEDTTWLTKQPT